MPEATSTVPAAQPIRGKWLSIQECASIACVTERTIHNWLRRGYFGPVNEISSRPIPSGSGRRFVDRSAFESFLDSGVRL